MSTTLDHGIVKPATGETGATFFPILENNIQYASDILSNSVALSGASWGSDLGGGSYRQLVTIPSALTAAPKSFTFETLDIMVRTTAGAVVYATIEKVSSTTFYVYSNDNTVALNVIFTA